MLRMTDWRPQFEDMGAVFERPDMPGAPHIDTLKSDTHSTDYFNSDYVEQHVGVVDEIADEWAVQLIDNGMIPDRVICHAPFAETPGASLARALSHRGYPTLFAYARLSARGTYVSTFPIERGERVVTVADDVVSGDSTVKTALDAETKGAIVLPVVPCLANLSLKQALTLGPGREPLPLLAAATFEPTVYRTREANCELCGIGSAALAPREGENWHELQSWMRRGSNR
jgi:orotate phosphoribosyltransferase